MSSDPSELDAIAADDQLVERLRRSLSPDAAVVWDEDDDTDDAGYALLTALQHDVSAPAAPSAGAVVPLRRRRLNRGATVAALTAGVLSLGGVAAAAATPPLAGVRAAVASAVSHVVDAVTPSQPIGPSAASPAASAATTPTVRATPPGRSVSDAVRAASADRQVARLLVRARTLLAAGDLSAARAALDAAARELAFVDAADRQRYRTQIQALRAALVGSQQQGLPRPETDGDAEAERDQQREDDAAQTRPTPRATATDDGDETGTSGRAGSRDTRGTREGSTSSGRPAEGARAGSDAGPREADADADAAPLAEEPDEQSSISSSHDGEQRGAVGFVRPSRVG
ncbi:MAG: hypothetical protein JWN77_1003 [Frankiales bacterium]|jgi:hypothetical protein|nr:hypothetical protein [Frankiales bacterium]